MTKKKKTKQIIHKTNSGKTKWSIKGNNFIVRVPLCTENTSPKKKIPSVWFYSETWDTVNCKSCLKKKELNAK